MSSIGSSLPASIVIPSSEPVVAAATTPAVETQSYKPQWLIPTAGSSRSFEMLGLPSPQSSADVAALIAQVSLSLESRISDSEKQSAVSKLGRLASSLTQFNNAALKTDLDAKSASKTRTADTKKTLEDNTAAAKNTILGGSGMEANAAAGATIQEKRIESLTKEISDLRADLALVAPTSDAATTLNAAIAAKTNDQTGIRSSLAQSRSDISRYTTDLANNQAAYAAENAKEHPDQNRLTSLQMAVVVSRGDLLNAQGALMNTAMSGLSSDTAALATLLATKTAAVTAAVSKLAIASVASISLAMVFSSAYQTSTASENTTKSERDVGIDTQFQDIAAELKEASARLSNVGRQADVEHDASLASAEERAENVALGILRGLTDVVSALAEASQSVVADPVGAASAARNRMRIEA